MAGNSLKAIISYRDGINYNDFIDGLIYIITKNPEICDNCDQEECYCNKRSKNNSNIKCYRCGRPGHKSNECYAKTTANGEDLLSDSEEYEEIFCCSNCGKEFDTAKGLTCHQNLYCKKSNAKKPNKNICYRCGRTGHKSNECYASTHIKEKY